MKAHRTLSQTTEHDTADTPPADKKQFKYELLTALKHNIQKYILVTGHKYQH
jgi:hypothetical protein